MPPEYKQGAQKIALHMLKETGDAFPICCESDEFHYFPQVVPRDRNPLKWDDFSEEAVGDLCGKLRQYENELTEEADSENDENTLLDVETALRASRTLREQFELVGFHRREPTFYLTVAGTGIGKAISITDREAGARFLSDLPAFMERAKKNLHDVPEIHRELAINQANDMIFWLASLPQRDEAINSCGKAIESFSERLESLDTIPDFRLDMELLDHVLGFHIGCEKSAEELLSFMREELSKQENALTTISEDLFNESLWTDAVNNIKTPPLPPGGAIELFTKAVEELAIHCIEQDIAQVWLARTNPVLVEPVPPYLSAVRSAAAYTMPPGHPPRGGAFHVLREEAEATDIPLDYRMLTAHETWPGHHLLDATRWSLISPVRRQLEFPLFYEGWACFSEELMEETGLFDTREDLLLLTRRHYWRAVRGLIDLGLQTGKMDFPEAADLLMKTGLSAKNAMANVKRYSLKPGYQVCYSFGLAAFSEMYRSSGRSPADFTKRALSHGEIGFKSLSEFVNKKF